ncbi:hypothetical protein [Staphylococcus epidermidis]
MNGEIGGGIVDRIDKDRCGLLMVGKNDVGDGDLVEEVMCKSVKGK